MSKYDNPLIALTNWDDARRAKHASQGAQPESACGIISFCEGAANHQEAHRIGLIRAKGESNQTRVPIIDKEKNIV